MVINMIRDITQNDRTVFLDMAEVFYSTPAVAHKIERSLLEATFNAAVGKSPYVRALIIEDGDTPVGFALLSFTHSTEVGGLVVLLEELYVNETYRGKGLGSKLLKFIECEYPEAKRFRLEVTRNNARAIDLYGKLGYKQLDYVQMVKDM